MALRIDRWRMYLLCLAADMRDAGVIDGARYRRIVGRLDEMDARDVVRVVEEICGQEHTTVIHARDMVEWR